MAKIRKLAKSTKVLSNSEQVSALNLVNALLEADEVDPDDVELSDLISGIKQDEANGKITYQAALTARTFYHRRMKYKGADVRPLEARRNGKTQTWKTRPGLFKIPVKYGLRQHFYIQNFPPGNADEWSTIPNPKEKLAYWKMKAEQTRKDADRTEIEKLQTSPLKQDPEKVSILPVRDPKQPDLFGERKSLKIINALLS